jgi:predicted alpha/beta superfamily hydrolase
MFKCPEGIADCGKVRQHGFVVILATIAQFALTALPGNAVHAAHENIEPYSLPGTATHTMYSEHVGDTFHISIALPLAYAAATSERKYPVLFMPDADIGFAMATQVSRLMELRQDIPALIIVGIGYGDLQAGLARRARDLTPTHMAEIARCASEQFPCGGAADFLSFIQTELKPFVAEHYRANVDDNAFFGYSLGGLFGLYVLFHEPDTFERYVIGSPSLWWRNGEPLEFEAKYADAHDDLAAHVFLSVGSLDEQDMADKTGLLAERLAGRGYPSLVLISHEFEGETHASAPAATFSRAMRHIFR